MDRCALVTGGARGIGLAIVERLRADGWRVHSVDIDDADLTTREGNRAVVEAALERSEGGSMRSLRTRASSMSRASGTFPRNSFWDALAASGDGRFLVVASVHGLAASPFRA